MALSSLIELLNPMRFISCWKTIKARPTQITTAMKLIKKPVRIGLISGSSDWIRKFGRQLG